MLSTSEECERTGMRVQDRATVTATQCGFMGNRQSGVYYDGANTKVRLNDCTMHHNGHHGLWAFRAVVDLHGTKTVIHSNERYGIRAVYRGKVVNLHLPFQHNTSHGNDGNDRHQHRRNIHTRNFLNDDDDR